MHPAVSLNGSSHRLDMLDKLCGIQQCSHSGDANATAIAAKFWPGVNSSYLASFAQECVW
jgi:hypothetical protein